MVELVHPGVGCYDNPSWSGLQGKRIQAADRNDWQIGAQCQTLRNAARQSQPGERAGTAPERNGIQLRGAQTKVGKHRIDDRKDVFRMVGVTFELALKGLTRVEKCDTCVFAGCFECKQIHGAGILPAPGLYAYLPSGAAAIMVSIDISHGGTQVSMQGFALFAAQFAPVPVGIQSGFCTQGPA